MDQTCNAGMFPDCAQLLSLLLLFSARLEWYLAGRVEVRIEITEVLFQVFPGRFVHVLKIGA